MATIGVAQNVLVKYLQSYAAQSTRLSLRFEMIGDDIRECLKIEK